ncbi:MAG: hypothetical protein RLY16_1887 [Bacteroidota bacterium]
MQLLLKPLKHTYIQLLFMVGCMLPFNVNGQPELPNNGNNYFLQQSVRYQISWIISSNYRNINQQLISSTNEFNLPFQSAIQIKGALNIRCIEKEKEATLLSFQLSDLQLIISGSDSLQLTHNSDSLKEALAKVWFVLISTHPQEPIYYFDPGASLLIRRWKAQICNFIQILPLEKENNIAAGGNFFEKNYFGKYNSSYQTKNEQTWLKQVMPQQLLTENTWSISTIEGNSIISQKDKIITTIEANEKIETFLNNRLISRLLQQFNIKQLLQQETLTKNNAALLPKHYVGATIFQLQTDQINRKAIYENLLGSTDVDDVFKQLDSLKENKINRDSGRLFKKFAAIIYLQPEQLERIATRLHQAAPTQIDYRILANAFCDAGTPEAQNIIAAEITKQANQPTATDHLLTALLQLKSPDSAITETILHLALEKGISSPAIARAYRYMAGTIASKLLKQQPKYANRVLNQLTDFLDQFPSHQSTLDLIAILGNAGSKLKEDRLMQYSQDADSSIRAAAVYALRFVGTEKSNHRLVNALLYDSALIVNRAAYAAIDLIQLDAIYLDQIIQYCQQHQSLFVSNLLELLYKQAPNQQQVKQLIEQKAKLKNSPSIQEKAIQLLELLKNKKG